MPNLVFDQEKEFACFLLNLLKGNKNSQISPYFELWLPKLVGKEKGPP